MDAPSNPTQCSPLPELDYSEPPVGSDRRSFMMRSAMAAAIVALGGHVNPLWAQTPAGKPLAYAQVFESGSARLFTAKGCVED